MTTDQLGSGAGSDPDAKLRGTEVPQEPTVGIASYLYTTFQAQVLAQLATLHANQIQFIIPKLNALGVQMAEDFTSLNTALADLQTEVGAIATQLDTLLADLLAAQSTGNQPAIDAATAAIHAQIAALQAAGTRDTPPAPTGTTGATGP